VGALITPARAPGRPGPAAPLAVFLAARRRRRRRWQTGAALALVASLVAAAGWVTWLRVAPSHDQGLRDTASPGGPFRPAAAAAVWFDGARLRSGDIHVSGQVTQRGGPEVSADLLPLVQAAGRVYWVNPMGGWVPPGAWYPSVVQYLDLATGRTGIAGPGSTAFLSADGSELLMAQDATTLGERPVAGGALRQRALPRGWYLPGGDGLPEFGHPDLATANGIVVQSRERGSWRPQVYGLWDPARRVVRVLGRGLAVIGSWTPPGARYSLLAWLPAVCRFPDNCRLSITNTATWATMTVRSPLPGGFAVGGAFSPDGTRLAVFPQTAPRGEVPGQARLALVDPRTGAVRMARQPQMTLGMDVAWALWLPDGQHLMVGASSESSLVDAVTLSARPLSLAGGQGHATGNGHGLNFTAAILPPGRR